MPTPPAPVDVPPPPVQQAEAPEATERWLFVDAAPRDGNYVELEALLYPLTREVEDELKTPHYLVPKFQEGPRHVAALFHNRLEHGRLTLPERLVVMRSLPAANEVLADLLPRYPRSHVIEGRR